MAARTKLRIRDLEPISATEAKNNFGVLLDRVTFDKERVLVQRGGKPSIVMLSLDDHGRLMERARKAGREQVAAATRTPITATYAKNNFGEMVHRVRYNHEQLLVQRGTKPVAVVMSIDQYQHFKQLADQPVVPPAPARPAARVDDLDLPPGDPVDLRLGICFPTPFAAQWDTLAWLTERGCCAVQVDARWVDSQAADKQENLAGELQQRGVELAAWSVCRSLVGPEEQVEQHVQETCRIIDRASRFASSDQPAVVVSETGPWTECSGRSPAWIWEQLVATTREIAQHAGRHNTLFAVTPERSHVLSDSLLTRKLLDEVAESALAVCLDPAGICADRDTVEVATTQLQDALVLAHARDVRFGPDGLSQYLPAGAGSLDYRRVATCLARLPRLNHLLLVGLDNQTNVEQALAKLNALVRNRAGTK